MTTCPDAPASDTVRALLRCAQRRVGTFRSHFTRSAPCMTDHGFIGPTDQGMLDRTEHGFLDRVAERLAALPAVHAVALGGSRARGTHTPDSDRDLAVYYRGHFDPAALRAVGWSGQVSEVGGWGGGVFNGGAWLTIENRRVDVHYRDLDSVEHERAEARQGRFH